MFSPIDLDAFTPAQDGSRKSNAVRRIINALYDIDTRVVPTKANWATQTEKEIAVWGKGASADTVTIAAAALGVFGRKARIDADRLALTAGSTLLDIGGFKVHAAGEYTGAAGAATLGIGLRLTDSAPATVALIAPPATVCGVGTFSWKAEFTVIFEDTAGNFSLFADEQIANAALGTGAFAVSRAVGTVASFYTKYQDVEITATYTGAAGGTVTLQQLMCNLLR